VLSVKRCGFKIESLHRIVSKSEVSAITAPVTLVIKVDEPQRKNLCAAPRRISQAVSGRSRLPDMLNTYRVKAMRYV
jgi:hypothetical protein